MEWLYPLAHLNINSLKRADIVIINGDKNESFEKKILKFQEI